MRRIERKVPLGKTRGKVQSEDGGRREGDVVSVHFPSVVRVRGPGAASRARGVIMPWLALVLPGILLAFACMSIDWGKLTWNVHQLQNAADAAALAGAQDVKYSNAPVVRNAAYALAYTNPVDSLPVSLKTTGQPDPFKPDPTTLSYAATQSLFDTNYDILAGRWIRQWAAIDPASSGSFGHYPFYPTYNGPDAVRVVARRQALSSDAPALSLFIAPVFGTNPVKTLRRATAWGYAAGTTGANAIYCLSQTANPGFEAWGNGSVFVKNGSIQVNSSKNVAAKIGGSSQLDCSELNVVGGTSPSMDGANDQTNWDKYMIAPYSINTGKTANDTALPDPLGGISLPVPATFGIMVDSTHPNGITADRISDKLGTCTLGPGYYPQGITMTGNPSITLDPTLFWDPATGQAVHHAPASQPVFYLGGVGLSGKNGSLTGHGVTIYIANGKNASLSLNGNVGVDLSSPADYAGTDPNGPVGIAIWQDPQNKNSVKINGCSGQGIQGTWYFPSAFMDWNGGADTGARQIIVDSMKVSGNMITVVDYDGRNDNPPARRSVLVQ